MYFPPYTADHRRTHGLCGFNDRLLDSVFECDPAGVSMIGMFLIKTAQDLIGSRDEVKSQKVLVLVDIPGDKRQRADF